MRTTVRAVAFALVLAVLAFTPLYQAAQIVRALRGHFPFGTGLVVGALLAAAAVWIGETAYVRWQNRARLRDARVAARAAHLKRVRSRVLLPERLAVTRAPVTARPHPDAEPLRLPHPADPRFAHVRPAPSESRYPRLEAYAAQRERIESARHARERTPVRVVSRRVARHRMPEEAS